MAKDDVDAFVVDMKMLASILGHNDDLIMEKFKDIFPDPNIEAALIAMDDFAAMQTKAKQLVQIYKPAHSTNAASVALLAHTPTDSPEKGKSSEPKSNQHQLAPINPPQEQQNRSGGDFNNGKRGRGRGNDHSNRGRGGYGNSDNRYENQERGGGRSQGSKGIIPKIEVEVKKTFQGADVGHGRIMIPITVIGIIGIDPVKAKIIVIEVGDGTATGDKMMVTEAEVDDGTNMINIPHKIIPKTIHCLIITGPHQWDASTNTKCRMSNTHPTNNSNNMPNGHPHNQDKQQIYVNYVKIKATMIINASSQVTLWPEHKRRLIKDAHIIIKTLLKGNGQLGRMIMMTPMASLFSSGGSRCR